MSSVLIIKIGAIGDVVLSLPILAKLKTCRVRWVVGKSAAPLLEAIEGIHHVIVVDEQKLLYGSIFAKMLEVLKIWKQIFFQRFDLVVTAHPDPRYRLLSFTCFKKRHHFFRKDKLGFPIRGVFHSFEYLKLVTGEEGQTLEWPTVILPNKNYGGKKPLVAFFPGGDRLDAGKSLRIWSIRSYVRCVELLQEYECECVLIGLTTDRELLPYFDKVPLVDYIGKTTLLELLALLKQCFCLVTHDGGALHLARFIGCKVCGIFGPTSPKDFACLSENEIAVWGGDKLECSPCYNGKGFAKCTHQSCMKQVTPEAVVQSIVKKWGLQRRENSAYP